MNWSPETEIPSEALRISPVHRTDIFASKSAVIDGEIHPPVRVRWGEQTKDEMAVAFLGVILPSPSDVQSFQQQLSMQYLETIFSREITLEDLPPEMTPQQRQSVTTIFNLFDKNNDGKLDSEERAALLEFIRSSSAIARFCSSRIARGGGKLACSNPCRSKLAGHGLSFDP